MLHFTCFCPYPIGNVCVWILMPLVLKLGVIYVCVMLLLLEHIVELLSLSVFAYEAKGTLREYEINLNY